MITLAEDCKRHEDCGAEKHGTEDAATEFSGRFVSAVQLCVTGKCGIFSNNCGYE